MIIGRGTFSPGQGHILRGTFTLTRGETGILMRTSADFFFDGSPEPDWALSAGLPVNAADPAVQAAALGTRFGAMPKSQPVSGVQTGLLPSGVDFDTVDTLFLWCFQVPFILGVGPIEHV